MQIYVFDAQWMEANQKVAILPLSTSAHEPIRSLDMNEKRLIAREDFDFPFKLSYNVKVSRRSQRRHGRSRIEHLRDESRNLR